MGGVNEAEAGGGAEDAADEEEAELCDVAPGTGP